MSTEFNDALRIVRSYADQDLSYLAKVVTSLGADNLASVMRRKAKDTAAGIPEIGTITAAQCSYFDNWNWNGGKKPRRGEDGYYGARHKVEVELWTVDAGTRLIGGGEKGVRNSAFVGTAALLPTDELEAHIYELKTSEKIKRPWRARVPDDREGEELARFGDELIALQMANPNFHVAPLLCSASRRYFVGHCVVVEHVGSPQMQVLVARVDESLMLDRYVPTYANGSPLKGNCILHSRGSKRAEDLHWLTCKL